MAISNNKTDNYGFPTLFINYEWCSGAIKKVLWPRGLGKRVPYNFPSLTNDVR